MKKKLILFINTEFRETKLKKRVIINEIFKEKIYKKKLPLILI